MTIILRLISLRSRLTASEDVYKRQSLTSKVAVLVLDFLRYNPVPFKLVTVTFLPRKNLESMPVSLLTDVYKRQLVYNGSSKYVIRRSL